MRAQYKHCERIMGVYAIVHVESGDSYIGSSKNIFQRISHHRIDLERKRHHTTLLQLAWNQFGGEAFTYKVLGETDDVANLQSLESEWIETYRHEGIALYNTREPFRQHVDGDRTCVVIFDDRHVFGFLADSAGEQGISVASLIQNICTRLYLQSGRKPAHR